MTQPIPERLEKLDELTLHHGGHTTFDEGHCAMELVSWLAGEKHSASPRCACPTITGMVIRLNDRMGHGPEADRLRTELLRPLLPKIIGTAGSIELRKRLAREACRDVRNQAHAAAAYAAAAYAAAAADAAAAYAAYAYAAAYADAAAAAAYAAAYADAAVRRPIFSAAVKVIEAMCDLKESAA